MIKALQLLFFPAKTWEKIVTPRRGVAATLVLFLLPLLALCSAGEGYALVKWGEKQHQFGPALTFSIEAALRYGLIQTAIGIVMVFGGATIIRWVGESFDFRPPFNSCFTLAAYGLSPVFLVRFLHLAPSFNIWVILGIGIFGCIYVLYQGIGIVLEPEQTKGFGLYLLIAFVFTLLSCMAKLIALAVLLGRLPT